MRIEVVILVILLQIVSVVKTQPTINMSESMAITAKHEENIEVTTATTNDYDVTRKTDAHTSEFTTGTQDVQNDVTATMETVSDQDEKELEGEDEYYEEDEENEEEEEEGYEYYDEYTDNDDVTYEGYNDEEYEGDDVTYGEGYDEDEYPEDDETEMYEFEYDDEDSNKTLNSYKQQDYLNGTTNKTRHKGARRGRWFCNP